MLPRHWCDDPEPPPPPTMAEQIERLKRELHAAQNALIELQQQLNEKRERLALISRVARNTDRCQRAPNISWAVVRGALFCSPDDLGSVGADLPLV